MLDFNIQYTMIILSGTEKIVCVYFMDYTHSKISQHLILCVSIMSVCPSNVNYELISCIHTQMQPPSMFWICGHVLTWTSYSYTHHRWCILNIHFGHWNWKREREREGNCLMLLTIGWLGSIFFHSTVSKVAQVAIGRIFFSLSISCIMITFTVQKYIIQ